MVAALVFPGKSFGLGIGLGVGDDIYVKDLPLGVAVATSTLGGEMAKVKIINKGYSACTYSIDILSSAQTKAPLRPGYKDIPDTTWIYPEYKEVRVEANSSKSVELYVNIPKKAKYADKDYQAVIEVKSKKSRPDEVFVLACQLRIFFSTLSLNIKEAKNVHK